MKKSLSNARGKSPKNVVHAAGHNSLASLFQKQQNRWDAMFTAVPQGDSSQGGQSASQGSCSEKGSFTCSTKATENSQSLNQVLEDSASGANLTDRSDENFRPLVKVLNFCKRDEEKAVEVDRVCHAKLSLKRTSSVSLPEPSIKRISSVALHEPSAKKSLSLPAVQKSTALLDFSTLSSENGHDGVESDKAMVQPSIVEDEAKKDETDKRKIVPYYLENFLTVINDVMADEFYADLFNGEDRKIIDVFQNFIDGYSSQFVFYFSSLCF